MARKVPVSPARADAALDAALDRAPRPVMPATLAARIVAQATALPQFPAEDAAVPEPVQPRETAQVIPFKVATPAEEEVPPATAALPTRPRSRFAAVGLAAIAATVVGVIILGQPAGQAVQPSQPAAIVAQSQTAGPSQVMAPNAQPEKQLARASSVRKPVDRAPVAAPRIDEPVAKTPETKPVPETETQLAASPPPAPRESSGPTSDPSPRLLPRGLMGPPAPQQGWGFSGAGARSLPGGQPMPSQTTGTMPPPPPPGMP